MDKKTNYSVTRVETYTRASVVKAERHNERKNKFYSNMNVDLTQTPNNVHYKRCETTYNERLKEMINNGQISLRGLKDNAKVFDEIIFDINSDYFEKNGGYKFAKEFYKKAFHFAEKEMGQDNIISAVMHADELNTALTEEYGKPIYDEKGKAVLVKSYSLLQDRFYQYMSDSGFRGFIRGIKGSNQEHLTDLEFKIKQNTERLEKITNKAKEKQANFDKFMKYDKQIEDISNLGRQKKFSKKIELAPEDYEALTGYAKKGIVADKEIYELNSRIDNLRNAINKWKTLYDEIVEKTKDYFHAIKVAPQKVFDLFKNIFAKEKQDELERQRIEQEKVQAERKIREQARLEKQNSPEYKKRRADRDAR